MDPPPVQSSFQATVSFPAMAYTYARIGFGFVRQKRSKKIRAAACHFGVHNGIPNLGGIIIPSSGPQQQP